MEGRCMAGASVTTFFAAGLLGPASECSQQIQANLVYALPSRQMQEGELWQ